MLHSHAKIREGEIKPFQLGYCVHMSSDPSYRFLGNLTAFRSWLQLLRVTTNAQEEVCATLGLPLFIQRFELTKSGTRKTTVARLQQ